MFETKPVSPFDVSKSVNPFDVVAPQGEGANPFDSVQVSLHLPIHDSAPSGGGVINPFEQTPPPSKNPFDSAPPNLNPFDQATSNEAYAPNPLILHLHR